MPSDFDNYLSNKEIFLEELRIMGSRYTQLSTEIQDILDSKTYSERDIWKTKVLLSKCLDDQEKYQNSIDTWGNELEEFLQYEEGGDFIASTLKESERYLEALENNLDEIMEIHNVPDRVTKEFRSQFNQT